MLGGSLKSLRRSVLRISSCSCLLRTKIVCAIGLTHICTQSKNENDLSATENEAVKQIQSRLTTIYNDGLTKFGHQVHILRARAETGERVHNAFLGPRSRLAVDPEN